MNMSNTSEENKKILIDEINEVLKKRRIIDENHQKFIEESKKKSKFKPADSVTYTI